MMPTMMPTKVKEGFCLNDFLSKCLCIALLLSSVFHTGISSVKADVRCYCNMPSCVSSGYMCKSSKRICVSDHFGYVDERGDLWRSRHACIELLQMDKGDEGDELRCATLQEQRTLTPARDYPLRVCCSEDMCNYAKAEPDPNSVRKVNHLAGRLSKEEEEALFFQQGNASSGQYMWLRAAVIAVPISGGFVLILLILVSAKMLREDHKRCRQQRSAISAEKSVGDFPASLDTRVDFEDPKRKVFLPRSISSAVVSVSCYDRPECAGESSGENGLYKNASIAASTDTACTDTSRDKYFVFDV